MNALLMDNAFSTIHFDLKKRHLLSVEQEKLIHKNKQANDSKLK